MNRHCSRLKDRLVRPIYTSYSVWRHALIEPPFPLDEATRLESLHSLGILDSAPEERFDRITRTAKRLFKVEICLFSLVDAERQWFKSKQGLEVDETERKLAFSAHAILDDKVFVVWDASVDPRFTNNPFVIGKPHIRFYAGCPVRGPMGHRVGTLCLIDAQPRGLSIEEQDTLRDLAAMIEDELALTAKSTIDELTQIANRRGFNNAARHMLSLCRRVGTAAEIAFFDLDGFKNTNNLFGHSAGDRLLKHFAKLLNKCFRSADVVARVGGDEFAVFMAGSDSSSDAAFKRLDKLAKTEWGDTEGCLNWSVGRVTVDPVRHTTIESLLADADSKMYEDKVKRRMTGS